MALGSFHRLSILLASILAVSLCLSFTHHSHSHHSSQLRKRSESGVRAFVDELKQISQTTPQKVVVEKRADSNSTVSTESSSWSSVNWGESSTSSTVSVLDPSSSSWISEDSSTSSSVFSSSSISSISSVSSSSSLEESIPSSSSLSSTSSISSESSSSSLFSSSDSSSSSAYPSSSSLSFSSSTSSSFTSSSFSSSEEPTSSSSSSAIPSSSITSAPSSSSYSEPGTTTSIQNGVTIIINHTTTITAEVTDRTSTATESSIGTASPTLASIDPSSSNSGISKKDRNIIIGCVVGIGVPLITGLLILAYFRFHNKGRSFINSEGELVGKKHGADAMIDEKYFDETVAEDDMRFNEPSGDDTMVQGHYRIQPNSATNF